MSYVKKEQTNTSSLRYYLLLSIICIGTSLPILNHGLWRGEARSAGICASMARADNFAIPQLNGTYVLAEKPLFFTVGVVFGKIFGVHNGLFYELTICFFTWLTICMTYFATRRRLGDSGGAIAAGVLASCWIFFDTARRMPSDCALTFAVALSFFAYQSWRKNGRAIHSATLGLALGLAFLAKGALGPTLIVGAVLADVARLRRWFDLWRIRPGTIICIAGIFPAIWIFALYTRGGWDFVYEAVVVNNGTLAPASERVAVAIYETNAATYAYNLFCTFAPWTLLLIPTFNVAFRRFGKDRYLASVMIMAVMLSVATAYPLALTPLLACMIAHWLIGRVKSRWETFLVRSTWGIIVVIAVVPLTGVVMERNGFASFLSVFAIVSIILLIKKINVFTPELKMTIAGCLVVSSCATSYYVYKNPDRDYVAATKVMIDSAYGLELSVVGDDEDLQAAVSLLRGSDVYVIHDLDKLVCDAIYLWCDDGDEIVNNLKTKFDVRKLETWELEEKSMTLAYVTQHNDSNDIHAKTKGKGITHRVYPFTSGEILEYSLSWSGIGVGKLSVGAKREIEKNGNEEIWHFNMRGRTNSFADAIYKIDLKIDSYSEINLKRSYVYKADKHEGKSAKIQVFTFDWNKKRLYTRRMESRITVLWT